MGNLPPEHSTVRATAATDETQSQLSSIQPPSTSGNTPGDPVYPDDADRHAHNPATPFDTTAPPVALMSGTSYRTLDSSKTSAEHTLQGIPYAHTSRQSSTTSHSPRHGLRKTNTGSSSNSSFPGLLKSIRTWGTASTRAEVVGGGQKQYPLSSRFYTLDATIGKGASATVCVLWGVGEGGGHESSVLLRWGCSGNKSAILCEVVCGCA